MRLLFEGGSYLRAALNNGFTVFQVDIPERNFVWTHSSWDPFAGSTDLSYENHYTFNDLIIVLIFFVAGFKNTDFLFFTPQFSRNFLISPPKNDSHIIKEHSFTLPKTLWWIWKKIMAVDAHIYLLQKKLLWDQKTTFLHFLYDD